ncbi:ABC transporter substrate-binding protein [Paenibacillus sp. IB182496]|uniref:ABC transporter substrate-binding protein n=1 Tax=Paenibacillus sabuli TaxID=2772509 RepID=A0A927GTI9_9BACL|nr:ABC transporter substrate-binding protein [Paenibacillus sabuli]MBD2847623.1 ABC transporter substrate-binding protein [Paenibacillus sabuli]
MRAKWGGTLACLLAAAVALGGCGGEAEGPVKLKVGEVTRSIFYAPQYAALSQGLFEEAGLAVELTTTFGGDKTMTELLAGSIDIALVGSETSIYVAQQGAKDPVINFGQLTQTDGTFLVAREPDSDFDWASLKDSTFLGQRKGGMPQMAGEFTLKKHGIDPQTDLELIQNIDFANIPAAFGSGTGDYVQLFEPQASIFEQEGRGYVVASFGVESGHLPYTAFLARRSFIEDHPEAIQAFVNALYEAQQWVERNSPAVIAEAIQPYFEDTEPGLIETVVERYKSQGSFATDPRIDEDEWNNLLEVMTEAGELIAPVPHAELVDNSFADQALSR